MTGRKEKTAGLPFPAALVILSVLVLVAQACSANDIPAINAQELRELLASDGHVLVVDTRSESEYARGRIPNAILIPEEKASTADRLLPPDTDKATSTLVFYCRGGG